MVLVVACGGDPTVAGGEPAPEPAAPEPAAATTSIMDKHYFDLGAAKEALIKGDIETAKQRLESMAQAEPPVGVPPEWAPHIERQRAALRLGAQATTPQGVGRGLAAAASVCGECHRTFGATVEFAGTPPPRDKDGLLAHMHRHAWAADRMWAGLVGPSDGAWADASTLLGESPLWEAPEGKLMSDAARMYALEVTTTGTATLTAASPERRIELYGDFLAACGSCHVVTSGGPGSSH
jgi:cytochrome c553